MGDFLLDFRPRELRAQAVRQAAGWLNFCEDTRMQTVEREDFSLLLSRVDGFELWGPYEGLLGGRRVFVALAGRIALEQKEWDAARQIEGPGGLACKAVFDAYRRCGSQALETLNGNYAAFLHDAESARFQIGTDRCGMYLAYGKEGLEGPPVFCSNADVLAAILGESREWDMTSLSEFLATGRLTFPFTYYRKIRGLDTGSVHTIALRDGSAAVESKRQYFRFDFKVDPKATEWDLAERLSRAFKNAVGRRSLPLFGRTAVALSGGLDSRAVLSATGAGKHIRAFTLYDDENAELRVASAIAGASGVELTRIRRDPEHYGNSAELGVRISGGTGCLASNHFLGVRGRLADLGFNNILTGCHCDYLLKGLALNKRERAATRLEKLAGFQLEFYRPHYWPDTPYREHVEERLRSVFPEPAGLDLSEDNWLEVERKRTFPLAYEADLAQRVIPQRVIPWSSLMADNDILDVYLRTPSRFKLNASVFSKMVALLCGKELCRIPDSNTGAPVNASWARYAFHRYLTALQNRIVDRAFPRLASRGSWPNWEHYVHHSAVIRSLWSRANTTAKDCFTHLLGKNPFEKPVEQYRGRELELFLRLLTQKLWLDQRN